MGLAENLKNQLFSICEFCVRDTTLEAYIVCFVCASDMVDGALDFLGVPHFHNGKRGSIRFAIVPHLNKKV